MNVPFSANPRPPEITRWKTPELRPFEDREPLARCSVAIWLSSQPHLSRCQKNQEKKSPKLSGRKKSSKLEDWFDTFRNENKIQDIRHSRICIYNYIISLHHVSATVSSNISKKKWVVSRDETLMESWTLHREQLRDSKPQNHKSISPVTVLKTIRLDIQLCLDRVQRKKNRNISLNLPKSSPIFCGGPEDLRICVFFSNKNQVVSPSFVPLQWSLQYEHSLSSGPWLLTTMAPDVFPVRPCGSGSEAEAMAEAMEVMAWPWGLEHPGRWTWTIIMEVCFRSFSFLNGWFVGSMLIFQGVTRTRTTTIHPRRLTNRTRSHDALVQMIFPLPGLSGSSR